MGTALGITNVVLRHLIQKGYIRATQANWRRWLYTLTPDGFSHKIRLTTAYINRVLHHYQGVRQILREQLGLLTLNEESRVALLGTEEFAELVYLGLREMGIEEIEVYGLGDQPADKFLGMPVRDLATLRFEQYDKLLFADINSFRDSDLLRINRLEEAPDNLVVFFANGLAKEGT
jgi:hypothetical protein